MVHYMDQILRTVLILLLLLPALTVGGEDKTIVHSVSKADMLLLRKVDQKYQQQHGIHLQMDKEITLGMLDSTKKSQGAIWLDNGKMRLEIHNPEPSKIIADQQYLWIESSPPADFENSKVQVMRASLQSKKARSQGLIQLLTQGGVLKYFRVSGIQKNEKTTTFFLQPDKQAVEFKRAQIVVDRDSMLITSLRYWDQLDNKTTYQFKKSQFNLKVEKEKFAYKPPAGAELIVY
jgi:chaperone LolA